MEAFQGFQENDLISSADYLLIVQTLIDNFPRAIILDSSLYVEARSHERSPDNIPISKYTLKDLSCSVYFNILYEEWIKLLQSFFNEEKDNENQVSIYRLKSKLESGIQLR